MIITLACAFSFSPSGPSRFVYFLHVQFYRLIHNFQTFLIFHFCSKSSSKFQRQFFNDSVNVILTLFEASHNVLSQLYLFVTGLWDDSVWFYCGVFIIEINKWFLFFFVVANYWRENNGVKKMFDFFELSIHNNHNNQ